jgi:hypothetical protein
MRISPRKMAQYAAKVALKAKLINEDVFAAFERDPVPIPPDVYTGETEANGEYWIRRLSGLPVASRPPRMPSKIYQNTARKSRRAVEEAASARASRASGAARSAASRPLRRRASS